MLLRQLSNWQKTQSMPKRKMLHMFKSFSGTESGANPLADMFFKAMTSTGSVPQQNGKDEDNPEDDVL